jgi:hypothetical protein
MIPTTIGGRPGDQFMTPERLGTMHQPAPDAPHNPKLRARDALAAMEECPFDDDDHRELGHAAIVHRAPDILIAYDVPILDSTVANSKAAGDAVPCNPN